MKIFKAGGIIAGKNNEFIEDAYLIIDQGLILGIEKNLKSFPDVQELQIVDYSNSVIVPGFINSHTHLSIVPGLGDQIGQMGRKPEVNLLKAIPNLKKDLYSGVTTTRVMCEEDFIDFYLRDGIEEGLIQGPRILTSGKAITSVNGHGYVRTASDGVEEVMMNCKRNLGKGANFFKVFVGGGVSSNAAGLYHSTYSYEEIKAAVDVAQAAGKYVAAHVHGGKGVDLCIQAGVKCIEHGSMINEEQLQQIIDNEMWITGTFSILFHEEGVEKTDMKTNPEIGEKVMQARKITCETFSKIIQSNANVSLGTDSMHGYLWYDAKKYVEFGATNQQAFDAITINAAKSCEILDRFGTLEVNKVADFVVLEGNPLEDISQLRSIVQVYQSGVAQVQRNQASS